MSQLPVIAPPQRLPSATNAARPKGTYAFVSLGCPKALVDSERMLGLLRLDGYDLVHEPEGADFAVVNTCGFIESARAESYASIEEMAALKRAGKLRGIIVSGCLAEREKEALLTKCPEVDQIVGVFGRDEVARVADRLLGAQTEQRMVFRPAPIKALSDTDRLRITPRHFAYLKVSEGCDRLCTFCAIPKMRGKHVTKPMEEVLKEAQQLAADGVRELNIVAQDTPYYGMDLYGQPRLAELLRELEQIEGLRWIRLLYFYPMYVSDELIDTIGQSSKIVPYVDMPLQHINDTMLRRMQRRVNRQDTESLIEKMRERIPGLAMRTTMITGFPGETDEQFEEVAEFVAAQRFERLGVFTYSLEPDTPAAKLPDHLPEEIKAERRERLMEVQQQVAFEFNEGQVGKTLDVLIDRPVPGEAQAFVGRTFADAPDIDSLVFVTGEGLQAGQFVPCEIVTSQGYDLVAAAVGKPH